MSFYNTIPDTQCAHQCKHVVLVYKKTRSEVINMVWFMRVLDTCCSHFLTIIAGVDLHWPRNVSYKDARLFGIIYCLKYVMSTF